MVKPKYEWVCDCGRAKPFRGTMVEVDDEAPNSEINDEKICDCGESMYYEEIQTIDVSELNIPLED